MISLKVEVSLFVPSPEIEDRNEVDAGYWDEPNARKWIGKEKCLTLRKIPRIGTKLIHLLSSQRYKKHCKHTEHISVITY
jgi:hypothetical protein